MTAGLSVQALNCYSLDEVYRLVGSSVGKFRIRAENNGFLFNSLPHKHDRFLNNPEEKLVWYTGKMEGEQKCMLDSGDHCNH